MRILQLFQESPAVAIAFLVAMVASLSLHEFAHAWTAWRLGDDTPMHQGRVTLNPAAHLDPIGSIAFLLLGFGWGRPVLYDPHNLSRRSDELLVALAGPASNLGLALLCNLIARVAAPFLPAYGQLLELAAGVNVALASFNMVPVPPLDGSSLVAYFWPEYRSLMGGQIGLIILLALIFVPIPVFGSILNAFVVPISAFFTSLTHLFGLL